MRKILLLLVVVFAIACGVAASTLRSRVAESAPEVGRALGEKLDLRVELGGVSVSVFPLAAEVRAVRVAGMREVGRPFLMIDALRINAELLPLLWGRLVIREIVADKPRVEIARNDLDASQTTFVPDRLIASLAEMPFSVTVHDGSVLVEDRSDESPTRLRADSIDGTVRGAVNGALEANLEGAALGERSKARMSLRVKPGVGPTGGDELALELDVDGGSAAALPEGFKILRGADLRDPLKLSLRASGLLGEKSTETLPAKPLLGKLTGSVGVVIAGLEDRLNLDLDVALDDSRYEVRGGNGTWSGLHFVPTGWVTRRAPRKLSGRLDLEPFELVEFAERLGAAERWRPHGRPDLTLRVTGTTSEPLYTYEGTVPEISFDGWPALPVKAGPVSVHGSLIAINTDVSTSFDAMNLQVGTARIDKAVFGLAYWHDKLTVTALDGDVYGGIFNGSAAFWPKTSAAPQGGMLLRDADGKSVIENVLPGLPMDIDGRLDCGLELGTDERGFWMHGRVGLHRGRITGTNWAHELVSAVLPEAAAAGALDEVTAAHRELLRTDTTRFERLALDFESRGGAVTLPRVVIEMKGASLRGRGEIAADRSVALTAALWPEPAVAATLTSAAPNLARARDAGGNMVLPCEVRVSTGHTIIEPTTELRTALHRTGDASPLSPVKVGPADFGEFQPLRKQFGR